MGQGVYQSQNMTVLAHLQAGHSITSWEAIQRWHITRLARVIDDLEKVLGYVIPSKWEASNGKRYKRYWLDLPKGQLEFPVFQQKGPVVEVHQALSCALGNATVSTARQSVA